MVPRSQLATLTHAPRPVLSIETSGHGAIRHPSLSISRDVPPGADMRAMPISRSMGDGPNASHNHAKNAASKLEFTPSLKRGHLITLSRDFKAENQENYCCMQLLPLCVSEGVLHIDWYRTDHTTARKLKCDGGRPACSQCVKRSNPCDYMPQNSKRRNSHRRKEDESDSEISGEERSADENEPSVSPEIPSQPLSRRSSNVDKRPVLEGFTQPVAGPSEPREVLPSLAPVARHKHAIPGPPAPDGRSLFKEHELPHIATLSLPESSPTATMTAPPLPPIRPASEQQAAQRKRASTVPGRSNRQTTSAGPKVVACNFCRGEFSAMNVASSVC
jgi:hypothetical protein